MWTFVSANIDSRLGEKTAGWMCTTGGLGLQVGNSLCGMELAGQRGLGLVYRMLYQSMPGVCGRFDGCASLILQFAYTVGRLCKPLEQVWRHQSGGKAETEVVKARECRDQNCLEYIWSTEDLIWNTK